jgi:hypothetical protein
MDQIVDLLDAFLRGVMAIAGGVIGALGPTGSVMLVITATIGLIWIAGRTLRL